MTRETIQCLVCGRTHDFGLQCSVTPATAAAPLRPIGSRLLVAPDAPPKYSAILETVEYHRPPETSGRVVALGKRFVCEACGTARPPRVQIGDRVIFSGVVGQDVTLGAEHYVMLDEGDVLAIFARPEVA